MRTAEDHDGREGTGQSIQTIRRDLGVCSEEGSHGGEER